MVELPDEFALPDGAVVPEPPDPPAEPRDAATVVLLRDTGYGPEAFLLRRVSGMAFAGGMTVFPGGGVDRRDAEAGVAWSGSEPEWWAEVFGCSPPLARALVCAAVRETFEESGVLLAGPDEHSVVRDTEPYDAARTALVNRELSLSQFLREQSLVLRADLLRPWANWVTPEVEPRRYDTRFLVAALPDGQRADGVTSEADAAGWARPAEAIRDWKAGNSGLLPPTWLTLYELSEFGSVNEVMAAERTVQKIIPRVLRDGSRLRVVLPDDPRYDQAPTHLDAREDDQLEGP